MQLKEGGTIMGVNIVETIKFTFVKMQRRTSYKYILMMLGLPVYMFAFIYFLIKKKNDTYFRSVENTRADLINSGYKENLQQELKEQLLRKHEFFNEKVSEQDLAKQVDKLIAEKFEKAALEKTQEQL